MNIPEGVVVYTKPHCSQCEAVKRTLRNNDVEFTQAPITPEVRDWAVSEGMRSAPIVTARRGKKEVFFCGAHPTDVGRVLDLMEEA